MTDVSIENAKASRFLPLRQRNFFLLWQGQLISSAGAELTSIAIALYVSQALGSTTLMGLILMAYALPGVVLGPLAGVIVDRHSRRRIIVMCDIVNGVALLTLAACFAVSIQKDALVGVLFAVALIGGVVNCFFGPALSAIIPDTVPAADLPTANALNSSTREFAVIGGQAGGGLLYALVGAKFMFLIDGLSYLFSATMVSMLRLSDLSRTSMTRPPFFTLLKEGFRYVVDDRGLRLVFVAASVMNFMVRPFFVLLPFFVSRRLGVSEAWYGYILAAISIGSVVGYWFVPKLRVHGEKKGTVMALSWVVFSACLFALGLTTSAVLSVALSLLVGASMGYFNVSLATVLQSAVPQQLRGRVFSLLRTIAMALTPVAMAASGFAAELVQGDISIVYISAGLLLLVSSIAFALTPAFRLYLAHEPQAS